MFTIDFTKPFLYKGVIGINQGNLATNNILRCKLITKDGDNLEGYSAAITFKTSSHNEINTLGNIIERDKAIVDIKFPSNALEVGVNELEILLIKGEGEDKIVIQSPIIKYKVWQGLTTGNGIQGNSNYPILVDLIEEVNNTIKTANNASATADASLKQTAKMLEVVNTNISKANEAIDNTNSAKDEALNAVEEVNAAKNSMIEDVNSTKNTVVADVNQAKNDMKITVDEAIKLLKQEYNSLTAQQQQELEVLQARDGEVNLNTRLERDLAKGKMHWKTVEGSYISTDDTLDSYLQNVEIKGNTIQNPNDLVDIKSVGDKVGDEELYRIPIVCTGKNIANPSNIMNGYIGGGTNKFTQDSTARSIFVYIGDAKECVITFSKRPTRTIAKGVNNVPKFNDILSGDVSVTPIGNNSYKLHNITTKYVIFYYSDIADDEYKIQAELGTQATPYEQYKEHKITILSPVQLEKVGDVTDRIIEKDGVWGVEKNNISKIGLKFTFNTTYEGWNLFECVEGEMSNNLSYSIPNIIYEGYKPKSYNDRFTNMQEGEVYITPTTNKIFIISKKDLNAINEETINRKTIIIAKEPRFIPLPNNQQIKLRTFTNKTNISFLTEIEGTIKADVAKSISASVNSNTQEISKINNRILDLEGLKESQEMSYETDKGYLVCKETRVGAVKDMKIYGKSLANIFKISQSDKNDTKLFYECDRNIGTTFKGINVTLFNPTSKKVIFDIRSSNTGYWLRSVIMNANELSKYVTLTDDEYIGYIYGQVVDGWVSSNEELQKLKGCCVVIIGDHTQNPPSYFEGIASVGTGVDKIEVSSIKSDGNLFNGEITSTSPNGFSVENIDFSVIPKLGVFSFKTETKYNRNSLYLKSTSPSYTRVIGLVSYNNGIALANYNLTDADLDIINQNPRGLRIEVYRSNGDCDAPTEICINKGDNPIPYQPYKQDKKPLLFKDVDDSWKLIKELRGLDTVCDTIELHNDGKYYYHQRTGKTVLNGSEQYISHQQTDNYISFILNNPQGLFARNQIVLCDKFIGCIWDSANKEMIWSYIESCGICISKSKLETQDVEGFKKWLQANNVTVIYQLAEEKVFEVNSLFLESYENETMVSVNSGVINAPIEFKITSYITNLVLLNQQRISILEQEIFSMFKAVLSGDMRALAENIYPEDFKVSSNEAVNIPNF